MANFQLLNNGNPPSVSPKFILPKDRRPQLSQVSTLSSVPIIDLDDSDHSRLVQQVSRACEEYGFFQIINHGIPQELCERMMNVVTNFFELPYEEKAQYFTTDHTKQVKLFNYYLKVDGQEERVIMWSQSFSHPLHPLDDIVHLLPKNPPQYGDVAAEYAEETHALMNRLFCLISQGLGLEKGYIKKRLGNKPSLSSQANYYPPCPNPELTLGLAVHTDLNALTVLRQSEGGTGLQVIKDGKWVAVNPVPNAFVVNIGDQIQVLSNGRYKSVHHRAVANKLQKRTSLAMFFAPDKDAVIGPIEDLTDEQHPPLYRNYTYAEFLEEFYKQEGTRRMVKEVFELHN